MDKLIYTCVSDGETIGNGYSFMTNILFNNISTVIGSIIMISIQVPYMLLASFFLYFIIFRIDSSFRKYNEFLKGKEKEAEINLLQSINFIQEGSKTIKMFQHQRFFKDYYLNRF